MQTHTSTNPAMPEFSGNDGEQESSRASVPGQKRDAVARGIDTAASKLRENAESLPGGEPVASAALLAANVLEDAADYVRDRDMKGMVADLRQIAVRHPGATLVVAAAFGFLLARKFSRS